VGVCYPRKADAFDALQQFFIVLKGVRSFSSSTASSITAERKIERYRKHVTGSVACSFSCERVWVGDRVGTGSEGCLQRAVRVRAGSCCVQGRNENVSF